MFDYELFTRASNYLHLLQGAALLFFCAAELYLLKKPGSRAELAAGAALFLAGLAGAAVILALPGGGNLRGLSEAFAERAGFRIFLALSLLYQAAGLSLLAHSAAGRPGGFWRPLALALLAGAALLYFLVPSRLAEAARAAALPPHALAGAALLLAAALKALYGFFPRRALQAACALLLLAASLPLLAYSESPEAFGPRRVSLEAKTPPVK